MGKLSYKDTRMMLFHVLRYKGRTYDFTQDQLKKYINIEFIQRTENWYNTPGNQYTNKYFKARYCTQDDFGYDKNSK